MPETKTEKRQPRVTPAEVAARFQPIGVGELKPGQEGALKALALDFKQLAAGLVEFVPESRSQSLALTALEEAHLHAQKGILHEG